MITTWNEGEQISDEKLEKLFEPFSGNGGEGKGLGLWVTYQIIISLKGSIEVKSEPDNTQFIVVLPIRSAEQGKGEFYQSDDLSKAS